MTQSILTLSFADRYKAYAFSVVRMSLALVFLWFGVNQLLYPQDFIGYLPGWTLHLPLGAYGVVYTNGVFEVIFGALLAIGLFTRLSALLLGIHLLGITISLGYNDIAVRDFGLALSMLAVFLHGPDSLCLESRKKKERMHYSS